MSSPVNPPVTVQSTDIDGVGSVPWQPAPVVPTSSKKRKTVFLPDE